LRRAQTRKKSRILREFTSVVAVETISVALPRSFVSFSSLCLLSVVEEESSEDAEQDADQRTEKYEPARKVPLRDVVPF
jgi:hypothetical protein